MRRNTRHRSCRSPHCLMEGLERRELLSGVPQLPTLPAGLALRAAPVQWQAFQQAGPRVPVANNQVMGPYVATTGQSSTAGLTLKTPVPLVPVTTGYPLAPSPHPDLVLPPPIVLEGGFHAPLPTVNGDANLGNTGGGTGGNTGGAFGPGVLTNSGQLATNASALSAPGNLQAETAGLLQATLSGLW